MPHAESRDCPRCGDASLRKLDDPITLSIQLGILECDQCLNLISGGQKACPHCGNSIEYVDPLDLPANRSRLEALGKLVDDFRFVADVDRNPRDSSTPITDEQFINYVNNNALFNSEMISFCKETTHRLDLSVTGAKSSGTHEGMIGLLEHAQRIRIEYDELLNLRPSIRFVDLHAYIVGAYGGILDLCLAICEASVAYTLEDVALARRAMQAALDRAAVSAAAASNELALVAPGSINPSIDHRLEIFTGRPGLYENSERPDFAAVLINALGQYSSSSDLAQAGMTYFRDMLSVEPVTLPFDDALSLYLLAAEVSVSEDPVSIRRRGNILFNLLNNAHDIAPEYMASGLANMDEHLEISSVNILGVTDQVRALGLNVMSLEAERIALSQIYLTLYEWVAPPLINVFVLAKFAMDGREKEADHIQSTSLADKLHMLRQESDPRYATALRGMEALLRNAGAHGGIDVSGELIRLRQVDRRGRVTEEELTDAQFGVRIREIFMTCLTLRLAIQLYRINRWGTLSQQAIPSKRRILIETANALVGVWGLRQANTVVNSPSRLVHMTATIDERSMRRDPADLLPAAVFLGVLFREWEYVQLSVKDGESHYCDIKIAVAHVTRWQAADEILKPYEVIRIRYLASLESNSSGQQESIEDNSGLIESIAAMLLSQINEVISLKSRRVPCCDTYGSKVAELMEIAKHVLGILSDVAVVDRVSEAKRKRLVDAVRLIRRGSKQELQTRERGRTNPLLQRACSAIAGML